MRIGPWSGVAEVGAWRFLCGLEFDGGSVTALLQPNIQILTQCRRSLFFRSASLSGDPIQNSPAEITIIAELALPSRNRSRNIDKSFKTGGACGTTNLIA